MPKARAKSNRPTPKTCIQHLELAVHVGAHEGAAAPGAIAQYDKGSRKTSGAAKSGLISCAMEEHDHGSDQDLVSDRIGHRAPQVIWARVRYKDPSMTSVKAVRMKTRTSTSHRPGRAAPGRTASAKAGDHVNGWPDE